jgi:hypothetical protein
MAKKYFTTFENDKNLFRNPELAMQFRDKSLDSGRESASSHGFHSDLWFSQGMALLAQEIDQSVHKNRLRSGSA